MTTFPDGFLWGLGTSALQIEGSLTADGRGPSIWEEFSRRDGAVFDGARFERACDSYRRWSHDVELLRRAGVGAYRFSLAWPRVLRRRTWRDPRRHRRDIIRRRCHRRGWQRARG